MTWSDERPRHRHAEQAVALALALRLICLEHVSPLFGEVIEHRALRAVVPALRCAVVRLTDTACTCGTAAAARRRPSTSSDEKEEGSMASNLD